MKRYTFYMSNNIRRQVYNEALRYLSPEQIRQIVGEQKKTLFWKNRAKVSDEAVEKLLEHLPNQVKLEVLTVIENDLKEALDSIEREKKELENKK
ncbi:hypothetical protein [Acidianus brierleyi]|uniref:Uncharacterized protein n=1 Tax=Acidianus brierleyi TaxID=41673 RepID=A0A2U9IH10_9CREN|nr:hypothetical protein [Acidianus brierleyi]AWR95255.1 hypothetical protein DFR85_12255 [Acidianus brierleyi]